MQDTTFKVRIVHYHLDGPRQVGESVFYSDYAKFMEDMDIAAVNFRARGMKGDLHFQEWTDDGWETVHCEVL